ncbi:MAG: TatD family deoxyribonuclease [Candidatus Aminicenantes bacterium]|nr:TatD family deoxyribonuclease [Candidatus Aminicenantes bacterium]
MDAPRFPPEAGGFFFVDSHCHLDLEAFDPDREAVIARARAAGVGGILCPIDIASRRSRSLILELAAGRPDIAAAAGLHPHQAGLRTEDAAEDIRRLAAAGKIRAVGEIGLDYHYDFAPRTDQQTAFRSQLALAQELGLPVIVHSRLAGEDIRAAVEAEGFDRGGVLHCFTESWEFARSMLERGFDVSFSGVLTFPKAGELRAVASRIPLDRLLVETDAPYLAPVPHRGGRNEPAFLLKTAAVLAGLLRVPLKDLAAATTANCRLLFGFPA